MTTEIVMQLLGLIVAGAPALLTTALAVPMLVGLDLSEDQHRRFTKACALTAIPAAFAVLVLMLVSGSRHVSVDAGDWAVVPEARFHFHIKLIFDRLSVPFVILSLTLCGIVGTFANVYLHRDPGFRRFFLLYSLFQTGMVVSSLAGTIETLFFGWELVGLSSALLVAYFHERAGPVRNGFRIWSVYRISDAAFLVAAITLHHMTGAGDFDRLMGSGPWPAGHAEVSSQQALIVGLLLLTAVAGKSGMVPFSGWLPRAMEGPTPSSAIFYGALSVHLGTFLLLRVSPLLDASPPLRYAVIALGLVSAAVGTTCAAVQTDVKNALAFASLTQVGLITIEIGLGLRYAALIHMIGHACLRTLQLLRAPSVLKDHRMLDNAIGGSTPARSVRVGNSALLYRFALHRAGLDAFLDACFIRPFTRLFMWFDSAERRWTDLLTGEQSRTSDTLSPDSDALEDPADA